MRTLTVPRGAPRISTVAVRREPRRRTRSFLPRAVTLTDRRTEPRGARIRIVKDRRLTQLFDAVGVPFGAGVTGDGVGVVVGGWTVIALLSVVCVWAGCTGSPVSPLPGSGSGVGPGS